MILAGPGRPVPPGREDAENVKAAASAALRIATTLRAISSADYFATCRTMRIMLQV